MLTLVESISLAGDRAKQNDDACGYAHGCAWVIDGATDLHDRPLTSWASDAAWIAHVANAALYASHAPPREALKAAAQGAHDAFLARLGALPDERWRSPMASVLLGVETPDGLAGADLGDCRLFALDAAGAATVLGGHEQAADAEAALAATQTDAHKPLLSRAETLPKLRSLRAQVNQKGAQWTFCLDPACADHARTWSLPLQRPAHILMASDGFAALADRYRVYDAAGLVRAALDKGLHELGRELRAIENADAGGAHHPRFKKSDDATAMLLRLD